MAIVTASSEVLVGREPELRRLRAAILHRESLLIWGAPDAGKTFLIQQALAQLSAGDRRKCVCWSGPATGRELAAHLLRELYRARDPLVRAKIHADRAEESTLDRWLNKQSLLRMRGILYSAAEQGDYRFFLDHLPPPTHKMAHFLKELMYRCKTPIYFTGNGYSPGEIGYAWSLYWTDEYRIRLEPLSEALARELLETCIQKFSLASLDLKGFREDILHLSGRLPGSIAKMCELAADPRYRYHDHVKVKLLHVDYLLQSHRFSSPYAASAPA